MDEAEREVPIPQPPCAVPVESPIPHVAILSQALVAYGWKARGVGDTIIRATNKSSWQAPLYIAIWRDDQDHLAYVQQLVECIGALDSVHIAILADCDDPVWKSSKLAALRTADWHEAEYAPCCYASDGVGQVKVAASFSPLDALRCTCHHIHHSDAECPGVFTAQEAVAVAGTFTRALTGCSWPRIPPQEVGNRLGVEGLETIVGGAPALPSLLLRYSGSSGDSEGISTRVPTAAYGQWLNDQWALTPKGTSVAALVHWRPRHVYVGRACPAKGLGASVWANPFRCSGPRKECAPEEAVERYERRLRSSPYLLDRLYTLSGKVLVCHCRTDMPCHRDVLIKLFNERCRAPVESNVVYAGQSHLLHRLARTEWSCHIQADTHADPEYRVVAYRDSLQVQTALDITALKGKVVVCECSLGDPCHVDALDHYLRTPSKTVGRYAYIAGVMVPRQVVRSRLERERGVATQWDLAVADAYKSLWPEKIASKLEVPPMGRFLYIEPFTLYRRFLRIRGQDIFGPLAPLIVTSLSKGERRAAEDSQKGTFFSAGAAFQTVSLGLSEPQHFAQAVARAESHSFPMDASLLVDSDLEMAAQAMVESGGELEQKRQQWFRGIFELSQCTRSLTDYLVQCQHPHVAAVASRVHVGLVGALVLLMCWPDVRLPFRYLSGFRCLGSLEVTGVLRPADTPEPLSEQQLLSRVHQALAECSKQPRDEPEVSQFLCDECRKDQSRGFAGPMMQRDEVDAMFGKHCWLPMPRFLHVQPNGKWRPIDDGSRLDHNLGTKYSETLDCVTAVQPALHVKALARAAAQACSQPAPATFEEALVRLRVPGAAVKSGTEDMPDAYRYVPAHPAEEPFNIVSVWDPVAQGPRFQVVYGHVFGRAAAVINFHRLQRLLNAVGKRLLVLLLAFYYDDITVQDAAGLGLLGQRQLRAFMHALGLPLAPKKQVDLTDDADYLGLRHDVRLAATQGIVTLYPREAISSRVCELIDAALLKRTLTPADAAKLRGILGFVATGMYGQVGRGGAQPLLRRQYADRPPYGVTPSLGRALAYYRALQQADLRRVVHIWGAAKKPIVVATDGRVDDSAPPSIAFVVHDCETGARRAGCAVLTPQLQRAWNGEAGIALVEQAAIMLAIQECGATWKMRDILWYVDNSVVLASMCKGASHSQAVDQGATSLHLILAGLRARVWWEYVETKSNWSDKLSRDLYDVWLVQQGFDVQRYELQSWPWTISNHALAEYAGSVVSALG